MAILTQVIRYAIESPQNPIQLRWFSSLGATESYTFKLVGKATNRSNIKTRLGVDRRETHVIQKQNAEVWQLIGENVTKEQAEAIGAILDSNQVYYCATENEAVAVTISKNSLKFLEIKDNLQTVILTITTQFKAGI